MEVEEEMEEEQQEEQDEDRRKLRSSIRGDPILSRAQPAPPPDPYFAPLRHETLNAHLGGPHGTPHHKGTMSSFLKASGKDKYCKSRLDEIDKMLKQTVEKAQKESGEDKHGDDEKLPSIAGSMSARAKGKRGKSQGSSFLANSLNSRPQRSKVEIEALASEMVTHIQNMPVFHAGNKVSGKAPEGKRSGKAPEEGAEDGPADGEENGAASESPKSMKSSVARSSVRTPRSPKKTGLSSLAKKGQAILRDLDPHVETESSTVAPTQRLHSNWPFEARRQLARHFYGMSPARILEEEEKEQAKHTEKNDKPSGADAEDDENYPEEGRDESPEATQKTQAGRKKRPHLRGLNTYTQDAEGGAVAHRLEIRIRNTEKTQRVVVGERTTGPSQPGVRHCSVLDENQARPRAAWREK